MQASPIFIYTRKQNAPVSGKEGKPSRLMLKFQGKTYRRLNRPRTLWWMRSVNEEFGSLSHYSAIFFNILVNILNCIYAITFSFLRLQSKQIPLMTIKVTQYLGYP